MWVCKLSLTTAALTRFHNKERCFPVVFFLDVFDEDGLTKVFNPTQDFTIISNPPWARPKFQINYYFKNFFNLAILPKNGSKYDSYYMDFKKIITFGRSSTKQYYDIWKNIESKANDNTLKELMTIYTEKWEVWLKNFFQYNQDLIVPEDIKNISFKDFLRRCLKEKTKSDNEKQKFSEKKTSSKVSDEKLGDRSCAPMFFSRLVRSLPKHGKFAIVQPDTFFVGDTPERKKHISEIHTYFCFSKNRIPSTREAIFAEVHTGTKFGVVLGVSKNNFATKKAKIFLTDLPRNSQKIGALEYYDVVVTKDIINRFNNFCMLPIFDSKQGFHAISSWIQRHNPCLPGDHVRWREGLNQSNSRNRTDGVLYKVASSSDLKEKVKLDKVDGFIHEFRPVKDFYESRILTEEQINNLGIRQERIFIADINRNAPTRHECLVLGKIPKNVAILNNLLWLNIHEKSIDSVLKLLNSGQFEKALYVIARSNHINCLALNWLGYQLVIVQDVILPKAG